VRFDETTEATAYLCVFEALTNAAKYAPGHPVAVSLSIDGADLQVKIADQGDGFDPAAHTTGTGLAGLRDRLDALGGRHVVDSAPGRGTTLLAVLPRTSRA
jgi:signal transduction histidine kinase